MILLWFRSSVVTHTTIKIFAAIRFCFFMISSNMSIKYTMSQHKHRSLSSANLQMSSTLPLNVDGSVACNCGRCFHCFIPVKFLESLSQEHGCVNVKRNRVKWAGFFTVCMHRTHSWSDKHMGSFTGTHRALHTHIHTHSRALHTRTHTRMEVIRREQSLRIKVGRKCWKHEFGKWPHKHPLSLALSLTLPPLYLPHSLHPSATVLQGSWFVCALFCCEM